MNNIHICTLSLGKEYNHYSSILAHSAKKSFLKIDQITIVTNEPDHLRNIIKSNTNPKINIVEFNEKNQKVNLNGRFNYNLKRIAIKEALNFANEKDIIVWLDCDTVIVNKTIDRFKEELKNLHEDEYIATRPAKIGDLKKEERPLGDKKILLYELHGTDKYDDAHAINEQVLIIRNSYRLHIFLNKWDELAKICDNSPIQADVEGIEMGVSLCEAGMKPKFPSMLCFSFYSNKTGNFFSYGNL